MPKGQETVTVRHTLPVRKHLAVGNVVRDPEGRLVYIIDGCFFAPSSGRLSNHWEWKRINANGTLSKTTYAGYGWLPSRG